MNNSAEQKIAAERALLLSSSAPETPLPAETVSLANVAADLERDLDEVLAGNHHTSEGAS